MPKGVYERKPEYKKHLRERIIRLRQKRKYGPRTKEEKQAISIGTRKAMEGKHGWSYQKTKETHPSLAKLSEKLKGRSVPLERRERIRQTVKANPSRYWLNKHRSEETKRKLREARSKQKPLPRVNTKPELAIRDELDKLNIKYFQQFPLYLLSDVFKNSKRSKADFYLYEFKILVFVDGDFTHANPELYKSEQFVWKDAKIMAKEIWERDAALNKKLELAGLDYIRIKQRNIEKNASVALASELKKFSWPEKIYQPAYDTITIKDVKMAKHPKSESVKPE